MFKKKKGFVHDIIRRCAFDGPITSKFVHNFGDRGGSRVSGIAGWRGGGGGSGGGGGGAGGRGGGGAGGRGGGGRGAGGAGSVGSRGGGGVWGGSRGSVGQRDGEDFVGSVGLRGSGAFGDQWDRGWWVGGGGVFFMIFQMFRFRCQNQYVLHFRKIEDFGKIAGSFKYLLNEFYEVSISVILKLFMGDGHIMGIYTYIYICIYIYI